jgi:putative transposase
MVALLRLLPGTLRRSLRSRSELMLENLALRQQLSMCERPPRAASSDRLFWSLMARFWPRWRSALLVVRPETVVRWHRAGFRRYWRWRSRRSGGRPPIPLEARELIAQIARENPRWGAVRIQAELRVLGYEVSAETVRRYRLRALLRPPSQRWQTFLRNHRPELWAADFFTVQTLTFRTLYVFFFISHARRRIEHVNVTAHPTAVWVWRQLIEATPWGRHPRFLIRDLDRSYGGNFIERARALGIETVLTPIRAPQANGIAERVIGSMRRECFDHIIPVNERHVRRVLRDYVTYYNEVRPHRTLELEPPDGPRPVKGSGQVVSIPVLGGLHHRYARAAA